MRATVVTLPLSAAGAQAIICLQEKLHIVSFGVRPASAIAPESPGAKEKEKEKKPFEPLPIILLPDCIPSDFRGEFTRKKEDDDEVCGLGCAACAWGCSWVVAASNDHSLVKQ